jgi:hypothetical protein
MGFEQMGPGLPVLALLARFDCKELNKQAVRESLQKIVQRHAVPQLHYFSRSRAAATVCRWVNLS